ncbi:MAG: M28 family metallopeptidase [Thermoplasmatota archaeon]
MRAAVLVALLLAGCSALPAHAPAADGGPVAHDVAPTGEGVFGYLENFTMTHPFRLEGSTQGMMDLARSDLTADLKGFHLDVRRQAYDGVRGENILAFQNGTSQPNDWVVLSAHYDTTSTTVYGAWDDGSGTAALLELARTLSHNRYPFTVLYAFFDQEEEGIIGSTAFVKDLTSENHSAVRVLADLNTDPPGLNWPCGDAQGPFPVRIVETPGPKDPQPKRQAWMNASLAAGLDAAHVPLELRDYGPHINIAAIAGTGVGGGSDHEAFWDGGIVAAFVGSLPMVAAGPAQAIGQPLHTPLDTDVQMEALCNSGLAHGGGTLQDGYQTIVTTLAGTLRAMASNPAP